MSLIVEDGSVVAGAESFLSLFEDRVHDTSQSTGSGTITLDETPPSGFRDFSAIGDGNSCKFLIDDGGGNWELCEGVYTDPAKTLSRVRVIQSSNSGSLVDFASGSKDVVLVATAEEYTLTSAAAILGEGVAVPGATGDGTEVTVTFGAAQKDVGSNMSGGTTYTAPATGAYLMTATVRLYSALWTSAHDSFFTGYRINSSTLHTADRGNPYNMRDIPSTEEIASNICEMHPMNAGDTLVVRCKVDGGDPVVTVEGYHFGVTRVL